MLDDLIIFNNIKYNNRQMLQAQISDIQFYLMKIARLQSDLSATQDELMSARLRLRTAQDYQIKYQLLLKQTQQETSRIKIYQREQQQKIAQLITLKVQDRDSYWSERLSRQEKQIIEKYSKEVDKLNQQFTSFRRRHERCGNKIEEQDILAFKNKKLLKQNQILEQKIVEMKKDYERSREQESKHLKQTMEQKSKAKQDNQRKIYREKIQTLEKYIQELQGNLLDAKSKADPNREKQIERLKIESTSQLHRSNEQLQKINRAFAQKHKQIEKILQQKYRTEQGLINEKKELRNYIKTLQDKLYDKQKEHEIELIHLKQRMSKIRQNEVQDLKAQIHKIEQAFKQQKNSWTIVINDKDKQIERIKNKNDQDTQRHKDDKDKQLRKISELKERLQQYEGQKQAGQTQFLLKSMKQVDARQAQFNNYQDGVTFLDRQLKKAMAKIQQKNIQITKLVKDLNQLRKDSENQVEGLKQKNRKDKKYYTDKILQLEQQIKDLNQLIRSKDRQHKKQQRDFENKINQIERQNNALKDLNEELQKDYTRAIENKKAVQSSYRQERQKGLSSKSDLSLVKKQKWVQLQKQKSQLQAIFKEREEQLKNKHEVQTERLRHERDNLRGQNQLLKGLVQPAKKQNPDENKQNKQNLYSEYHKKMATLNLEIALTKNIYDSLIQAKSRRSRQSRRISQYDLVQETQSQGQNIQQKNPSSRVQQFLRVPELGMSFNPNKK